MEKYILPVVLLSFCLLCKSDSQRRAQVLCELLTAIQTSGLKPVSHMPSLPDNQDEGAMMCDTSVAAYVTDPTHISATPLALGHVFSLMGNMRGIEGQYVELEPHIQLPATQETDEVTVETENTLNTPMGEMGAEPEKTEKKSIICLDKYIRLGLDSTITQDITGVKKERMKDALQGFLCTFFVYDVEQQRVLFRSTQVAYKDVEALYRNLKKSKNLLGQGATFLGVARDPLGKDVDDFLGLLANEESDIYKLFSSCTQGVVGHMQKQLQHDLGIPWVAMVTDKGEVIEPNSFAKLLCEAGRRK